MNELAIPAQETELAPAAQPADQRPNRVYLASLAAGSRRTMSDALDELAAMLSGGRCNQDTMPWHTIKYQHVVAVRTQLAEHSAPATVNKKLSALKGVLTAAWNLEQMDSEQYTRACKVQGVKGTTLLKGRALPQYELEMLFAACKPRERENVALAARDMAILVTLYASGLRRAELVALTLADYDEAGVLTVQHGKGNKPRTVPIAAIAQRAIAQWLEYRGKDAGPLFMAISRHNVQSGAHLTPQAVLYVLAQRAARAGIRACSPHDLRRSYASNLIDAGADVVSVSKLMGHVSIVTTQKYDRRDERAKVKAANLLTIPAAV